MPILVNGIPIEDFEVCKGLWQGNPLSLFLFLLAVEGLARMVQKASNLGEIIGF